MPSLSQAQKRYLKGLLHHLRPVVMVGNKGLSETVLQEIEIALAHHELIKVQLRGDDREARRAAIAHISEVCAAELVQSVGHVAGFFRRNPDAPKVALPSA